MGLNKKERGCFNLIVLFLSSFLLISCSNGVRTLNSSEPSSAPFASSSTQITNFSLWSNDSPSAKIVEGGTLNINNSTLNVPFGTDVSHLGLV